jgi:NADP-dependent 3-hydroxy acid dehydrogenase YdfG
MDLGLKGKSVVVTGGSKGIGFAAASISQRGSQGCHLFPPRRGIEGSSRKAFPVWRSLL